MADKQAYDDDDMLFVGEAAELIGVHADTLRRWEERGLITAARTPTNHRRFRVADLRALLVTVEPAATSGEAGAA